MATKKKSARKAPAKKRVKAGTSKLALAVRRQKFRAEYIRNGNNGYQAALFAGYKPGPSAELAATRLMGEQGFQASISGMVAASAKISGLELDRTLREVARLAYSDPRRLYREDGTLIPVHEMDDETAATLASIENEELFEGRGEDRTHVGTVKKLKLWDKNAALEKAMKYHGLYREDNKQRAEASMPVTVIFGTGDAPKAG